MSTTLDVFDRERQRARDAREEARRLRECVSTEHDRQVAERAWDEGYGSDEECHTPRRNPYRKEQENNNA